MEFRKERKGWQMKRKRSRKHEDASSKQHWRPQLSRLSNTWNLYLWDFLHIYTSLSLYLCFSFSSLLTFSLSYSLSLTLFLSFYLSRSLSSSRFISLNNTLTMTLMCHIIGHPSINLSAGIVSTAQWRIKTNHWYVVQLWSSIV